MPASRGRLGGAFWKLFTATGSANLGDGVMTVAVPWLATAITRDAWLVVLVSLAGRLPWLLFSLPAGVIIDRFDRRRIAAWMDTVRFGAVLAFAALLLTGWRNPALLGLLCLTALVLGGAEVLRDNSAQSMLPSVVAKDRLARANGHLWGVQTVTNQFAGPPLAGLLLGVTFLAPFVAAFSTGAAMFAASAALLFALARARKPAGAPGDRPAGGPIAWRAETMQGLRWLWRNRLLRSMALTLGGLNACYALATAIQVLYAREVLHLDARGFGLLLTATAAGAVLGSALAPRIGVRLGPGRSLFVAIIGIGAGLVVTGIAPSGPVAWLAGVSIGLFIAVWGVLTVSLRQAIVPDHLLGRVNSAYRFFGWGTISLGALLGGALVSLGEPVLGREWALRAPFLVAAAGHGLLLLYALTRMSTARIESAQAEAEAAGVTLD